MEASILVVVLILAVGIFFWFRSSKQKDETKLGVQAEAPSAVQSSAKEQVEIPQPIVDSTAEPIVEAKPVVPAQEPLAPVVEELVSLKSALKNTEASFFGRIRNLFKNEDGKKNLDEIEEVLYTSDLGPHTVQLLMESLQSSLSRSEKGQLEIVKETLRGQLLQIFAENQKQNSPEATEPLQRLQFSSEGPSLWLIVGVNGAGKTTTIGKLAFQLAKSGKRVLIAAGDTFRAAAGGQLKVWADRAQVDIFSPEGVTDPSAVAFDAVSKAKAQGYDVVIVDTAGRLHTQQNLMEEIKKMKRVVQKVIPSGPHETLIVLDANQGQNALQQCREFNNALGLSGVILTKLDGTAKGGVAVGVAHEINLPIKLIGVGEKIQDLRVFDAKEFVEAIL